MLKKLFNRLFGMSKLQTKDIQIGENPVSTEVMPTKPTINFWGDISVDSKRVLDHLLSRDDLKDNVSSDEPRLKFKKIRVLDN